MKPALYPHAKDLVSRCRDEGHDVVLVSGALDFLMTRLADHLGATHVIANRLEIKDGFATGQAPPPGRRRAREGAPHPRARARARPRSRRVLRLLRQLLGRADALASSATPPR